MQSRVRLHVCVGCPSSHFGSSIVVGRIVGSTAAAGSPPSSHGRTEICTVRRVEKGGIGGAARRYSTYNTKYSHSPHRTTHTVCAHSTTLLPSTVNRPLSIASTLSFHRRWNSNQPAPQQPPPPTPPLPPAPPVTPVRKLQLPTMTGTTNLFASASGGAFGFSKVILPQATQSQLSAATSMMQPSQTTPSTTVPSAVPLSGVGVTLPITGTSILPPGAKTTTASILPPLRSTGGFALPQVTNTTPMPTNGTNSTPSVVTRLSVQLPNSGSPSLAFGGAATSFLVQPIGSVATPGTVGTQSSVLAKIVAEQKVRVGSLRGVGDATELVKSLTHGSPTPVTNDGSFFDSILAGSRRDKAKVEERKANQQYEMSAEDLALQSNEPSLMPMANFSKMFRRQKSRTSVDGVMTAKEIYEEEMEAMRVAAEEGRKQAEAKRIEEETKLEEARLQAEQEERERVEKMSPEERAEYEAERKARERAERQQRIALRKAQQEAIRQATEGMDEEELAEYRRKHTITGERKRAQPGEDQLPSEQAIQTGNRPQTLQRPDGLPLYLEPLEIRITYLKELQTELHHIQARLYKKEVEHQRLMASLEHRRQILIENRNFQSAEEQMRHIQMKQAEFETRSTRARGEEETRLQSLKQELIESIQHTERFLSRKGKHGSAQSHLWDVTPGSTELQFFDGHTMRLNDHTRAELVAAEQQTIHEQSTLAAKYPDMSPLKWWTMVSQALEEEQFDRLQQVRGQVVQQGEEHDVDLQQERQMKQLEKAQAMEDDMDDEEDEFVDGEEGAEREEEDIDEEGSDEPDENDSALPLQTKTKRSRKHLASVDDHDEDGVDEYADDDDEDSLVVSRENRERVLNFSLKDNADEDDDGDVDEEDQMDADGELEEVDDDRHDPDDFAPIQTFSTQVKRSIGENLARIETIVEERKKEILVYNVQTMSALALELGISLKQLTNKLRELDLSPEKGSQAVLREDVARLLIEEFGFTPVKGEQVVQPQVVASLRRKAMKSEEYLALPQRPAVITVMGHVDHGKCWGRGTQLLMYSGAIKSVEDIQEGDLLMGDDSSPRIVQYGSLHRGHTAKDEQEFLARLPHGCNNATMRTPGMYSVTPVSMKSRDTWTCNNDHILVLRFREKPSPVQLLDPATGQCGFTAIEPCGHQVVVAHHIFSSFDSACTARAAYLAKWAPFTWECSVDEFLSSDPTVQQAAKMYQPRKVQFAQPACSLRERLAKSLSCEPTTTQLLDHAFDVGRNLAAAAISPQHLCPPCSSSATASLLDYLGESHEVRCAIFEGVEAALPDWRTSKIDGLNQLVRSIGISCSSLSQSEDQDEDSFYDSFTLTRVDHAEYFGFTLDGNGRLLMRDFVVTHNTSLLDRLRRENRAAGEAGGITQSIGAFRVDLTSASEEERTDALMADEDDNGRPNFATFLDTPGHAAFKSMRAKGCSSNCTDMVILVISAADGLQPQSLEVIQLARQNNVPLIIAINKIDVPGADPNAILQQLQVHDVVVESLGGEVLSCNISAKTGEGIGELKELIRLTSEVLQLHADRKCSGEAYVLESRVLKKGGCIANILVRNGTVQVGQYFVCGLQYGKIRSLHDENDRSIHTPVYPGSAVQLTGLKSLDDMTEDLYIVDSEEHAMKIIADREQLLGLEESDLVSTQQAQTQTDQKAQAYKIQVTRRKKRIAIRPLTEDEKASQAMRDASVPVLVKSDVSGSMEVLLDYFSKLPRDQVLCSILKSGLGEITAADVEYASEVGGLETAIFGFNVKATSEALLLAKQKGIRIYTHAVIYSLWDDVRDLLSEKLPVELEESELGQAVVQQLFPLTGGGGKKKNKADAAAAAGDAPPSEGPAMVAGCRVKSGKIDAKMKFKILRDEEVVFDGSCISLRVNRDVKPFVEKGGECGIRLSTGSDSIVAVGDIIECYTNVRKKQLLDDSIARGFVAQPAGSQANIHGDAQSYA